MSTLAARRRAAPRQVEATEAAPGPRARGRLPLAVAAVVTLLHGALHLRFTMDDSAISYGYARSFADGLGLGVLQEGAGRVEGYSNPAWVVLLAAGDRLGLAEPTVAKVLALALPLATIWVFFGILRRLTDDPRALWAGCLLAVTANVAIWDSSGLESPLHLFLLVAAARLLLDEDEHPHRLWPASAVVLVLAVLTRLDAALFLLAAAAFKLVRGWGRRSDRRSIAAVAVWLAVVVVLLGTYLVWHRHHFGTLAPNTAIAKGGGLAEIIRNATPPNGEGVRYVGSWLITGAGLALVPAMVVGAARAVRSPAVLLVTLFTVAALVLPLAEPDWMREHRFLTAFAVFAVALVVAGIDPLLRALSDRGGRRRALAVVLVPLAVFALVNVGRSANARRSDYRRFVTVAEVRRTYRPLVAAAHRAGLGDPLYAVPDIGATSYDLDMRVLDIVGLADYHAARTLDDRRLHAAYLVDERRPHLLASHGPWEERTHAAGAALASGSYVTVDSSTVEGMYGGQEVSQRLIRRDVLVREAPRSVDVASPPSYVADLGLAGGRLPVEVLWPGPSFRGREAQRTRLLDGDGSVVAEDVEALGHGWLGPDDVGEGGRIRQTTSLPLPDRPGPYQLDATLVDGRGRPRGPVVRTSVTVVAAPSRVAGSMATLARDRWAEGDPVAATWSLEWGAAVVPDVDLDDAGASLRRDILDELRDRAERALDQDDVAALGRITAAVDEVRGRSSVPAAWGAVGRACAAGAREALREGDRARAYGLASCASRLRLFDPAVAADLARARREALA